MYYILSRVLNFNDANVVQIQPASIYMVGQQGYKYLNGRSASFNIAQLSLRSHKALHVDRQQRQRYTQRCLPNINTHYVLEK